MEISPQKLEEFIALYRAEYGEELTREQALEQALSVVQLVKLAAGRNEDENYGAD
jgi:hypothetical protein